MNIHTAPSTGNHQDYESEDDMIIYGDGTERDNVRLDEALPTQCSQPTIPSACNPNGGPNLISREERRKRRREWKEHQLLEARQDDEIEEMNFEHHLDNEDKYAMEDTFASLQALLEESATPHQTQDQEFTIVAARPEMCRVIKETHEEKPHVDKMEETSYCLKAEDRNVPQKSGVSPGPIANQDSEEYSPPDFAMYNDDYEDDDNIDISTNHRGENGLSLVATRDKTSFKTRIDRKKEKTKCKKSRDQVKRTRSSPSSKPPFSTRHSHSKESGKPEESISYAITEVTQNERTIVGMRPSHWQRQSKNESFHRRLAGTVETSSQSKMSRMRLLRESIVRPRLAIPDNKKIRDAAQKRKNVSAILQRGNTSNNQQNTPVSDELHRGSIIAEKLRNMSYRPTTMPKPQATETLSNRMDATADAENAFVAPALNRSSFSSPTLPGKNRSSKHHNKGGAWTKRLAILKSNQTNDVMKLQHDGMNRHSISYDLNDPRKRANTYTDVTILSDEDCHGVNIKNWVLNQTVTSPSSGDGTLLTVSSYIHEHAPVKGSARESVGKSFAWISFTRATARNVGLENGMNLRIYNAVLLPVRQGSGKTTIHGSKTESRFLVICTQLCERHPSVVSHVPNLDTAMITEGQTDYDVPTGTR